MEAENLPLSHRRHPPDGLSGGSRLVRCLIIVIPRINHPEDDGGGGTAKYAHIYLT